MLEPKGASSEGLSVRFKPLTAEICKTFDALP